MITIFDPLRNFTTVSVVFRLVLAFLCGTIIGLERSYHNKPAGFRTHTLVCLAACIASITGLYLYLVAELPTDMSRIGAQVISGLGFIGAGTIVVTKNNTVKGLTTAAGMWTAGIIGLCIGAGYYEGGILATLLVLFVEIVMNSFRKKIRHSREFRIAVSYYQREELDDILRFCKDNGLAITNLKVTGSSESDTQIYSALIALRENTEVDHGTLMKKINNIDGVISAEEI